MIRFPNGGELFDFQKNASNWLLDNTGVDSETQTLIIKAPTGSGKTIILLNFIDEYFEYDYGMTSFIWLSIGSGELEEQSKAKMDTLLPSRKSKTLTDALDTGFEGNDVTFINWESVTKKGNRATRMGDMKNIKDQIAAAHRMGVNFTIIVDEEHRYNTAKAHEFMDNFSADNIIRVSATTIQNSLALTYEIPESEVIASGLITSAMYVNDRVDDHHEVDMTNEHEYLLDLAIKKRDEIQIEYDKINKGIRPLIIIQFPDASDDKIKAVELFLEQRGYSYRNEYVAKWLSEEKINTSNIEKTDATPLFLLWKQALSTGWDCPRAKILVKLREGMNDSFETQTIGRIRRMPEAKHYGNSLLDNCFMYTFDEQWTAQALKDPTTYETKEVFIKEQGRELTLNREVRDTSSNNFGERDIRKILAGYFIKKYDLISGPKLTLQIKEQNKKKMEADSWLFGTVIDRTYTKGKFVKITDLLILDPTKQGIISREVNTHANGRDVMHIINELHGIISITDSAIRSIMRTLFHKQYYRFDDNLLSLENREWYAFIINNRDKLKEAFREVKSNDLQNNLGGEQISLLNFYKVLPFRIPLSEIYTFDGARKDLEGQIFSKNVYKEYQKNMVTDKTRSRIEQMFEYYCESNNNIEWFFKNGDKGDKYFSIAYQDGLGQVRLFYPDYIIKMTNGKTWIIETKGGEASGQSQNIDDMAETKFNTFKTYSLRYPDLRWGFVRNIGEELFLNNTIWIEAMAHNDQWIAIQNFF